MMDLKIQRTSNETGLVLRPSNPSAKFIRSCSTRLFVLSAQLSRARSNSSGWLATFSGTQYGQCPDNIYDSVMPLGPFPAKNRRTNLIFKLNFVADKFGDINFNKSGAINYDGFGE